MLKKSLYAVRTLLESVSCCFLVVMLFCATSQVVCRFILKVPAVWTEEYAKMSFITLVLLMWPVLEYDDTQLKVTYFLKKMPVPVRTVVFFIINILYIAFIILFWASALRACLISWDIRYSAIQWINAGIQYIPSLISLPVALIFVVLRMCNFRAEVDKHSEYDIDEEGEL